MNSRIEKKSYYFMHLCFLWVLFLEMNAGFSLMQTASAAEELDAKSLYDKGAFAEALALFEKKPEKTSSDYYNIGNCYYRLSHLGKALAFYEKALSQSQEVAFSSTDDITHNIQLTTEKLNETGSLPVNNSFFHSWITPRIKHWNSLTLWILLFLSSLGFLNVFIPQKKPLAPSQKFSILSSSILIFALSLFCFWIQSIPQGMILGEPSVVRSGPSEKFTELMQLPAGTRINLKSDTANSNSEQWVKIEFSLGNIGWISAKDYLRL